MDPTLVVATVSLIVAVSSAAIAYLSVREQRRLTTNVASYNQLASLEMLLEKNPDLLKLHSVDLDKLKTSGLSPVELVYLAQSFAASDFFHRLADHKAVALTDYRKNLLLNAKVRTAWELFIRGKFVSSGSFSEAVDRYLLQLNSEPAQQPATTDGVAVRTLKL